MPTPLAFSTAKAGNAEPENEDAVRAHPDEGEVLIAVADGATDSIFSGLWAQLLVTHFHPSLVGQRADWRRRKLVGRWVERIGLLWREAVAARELPWYAEHKLANGAHAALVAVNLQPRDDAWEWSAVAVGDCTLCLVERDELATSFPIQNSEDFNNNPFLVGTTSAANADLKKHIEFDHGAANPGAVFYVMSDALAQWFLAAEAAGKRPWRTLSRLKSPEHFQVLVRRLRRRRWMRNDDVSLVMLEI